MGKRRLTWLGERIDLARVKGERVDRDARIIYGVKVLGLESRNNRRYTKDALKAAVHLYEGVSVRRNHPKKATDQRDVDDVFGWLEAVEIREDGLYANLHYLVQDELADKLCEAAERKPDLFGLSHNADGRTEVQGGEVVVLEIAEVRSVDLVADPATVTGLFESRRAMPTKLKAFMEAATRKLDAGKKRLVSRLFEAGYMDEDHMMEQPGPAVDAGATDHETALRDGFEASAQAIVSQCLDGEMDCKEGIKKIGELLKTHEKLSGGKTEVDEEEGPDIEDSNKSEKGDVADKEDEYRDTGVKESRELRRKVRDLEAREAVRELCEQENVKPSKLLVSALVNLSEADRKAFLAEHRGTRPATSGKPRTSNVSESKGGKDSGTVNTRDIADGKGFAALLRRGDLN